MLPCSHLHGAYKRLMFSTNLNRLLSLCPPGVSLHPEKAARENWPQPTVRPGWAPTCEDDSIHPGRVWCWQEEQPPTQGTSPQPTSSSCFPPGRKTLQQKTLQFLKLCFPRLAIWGDYFSFLSVIQRNEEKKCSGEKLSTSLLYVSGRRCTLLCLHLLTARF